MKKEYLYYIYLSRITIIENIAMNYNTLQPFLEIDKSNPFFEVLFNPAVLDELLVHFGMRLLETVPRNSFQSKLLIARLFNAGYNLSELSRTFTHAIKPILTRWLQENDMGYLIALGINQITSYSYFTYKSVAETVDDKNIKNKEFIYTKVHNAIINPVSRKLHKKSPEHCSRLSYKFTTRKHRVINVTFNSIEFSRIILLYIKNVFFFVYC